AALQHDWPTALAASLETAQAHLDLGIVVNTELAWALAAAALSGLGHAEPAAVLLGASHAASTPGEQQAPAWSLQTLSETRSALRQALGNEQAADLAAKGATLTFAEAVEYLKSEMTAALAGG